MRRKLSVIIHTYNSEKYLKHVLRSVKFAQEIIVADMGSTDKTVSIATKFGAKVLNIKNEGFADPARPKIYKLAQHEYILVLDSDEVVSGELKKTIETILDGSDTFAYYIPRLNWMLGVRINPVRDGAYGYDRQLRLSPNNSLKYSGKVHEQPEIKSGFVTKELDIEEGHLEHFSHLGSSDIIRRGDTYAFFEAERSIKLGKSPMIQMYHLGKFVVRWVRAGIYKQGLAGWVYLITDIIYRANVIVKIAEYKKFKPGEIEKLYQEYMGKLK